MKYPNMSKWGKETARKRGYADGGTVDGIIREDGPLGYKRDKDKLFSDQLSRSPNGSRGSSISEPSVTVDPWINRNRISRGMKPL